VAARSQLANLAGTLGTCRVRLDRTTIKDSEGLGQWRDEHPDAFSFELNSGPPSENCLDSKQMEPFCGVTKRSRVTVYRGDKRQ
jgi:hypothetical protein